MGWHSRGYLPHRDEPGRAQFLTWRLADAVPSELWSDWKRAYRPDDPDAFAKVWRLAEAYMDCHGGEALLRRPEIATIVMESFVKLHGHGIRLHAAVVIPNHVHCVLEPDTGTRLSEVVKAIKGATARTINLYARRSGRLWEPDYFDRLVRDADHMAKCVHYVHWNPVKAGLTFDPRHFEFSTACPRYRELFGFAEAD